MEITIKTLKKKKVILMEMQTLLGISIALMAGLFMSRIVKPFKLPAVTGYLIAGILIGPYCLGRLGIEGIGFTSVGAVASSPLQSVTSSDSHSSSTQVSRQPSSVFSRP